MNKSDILKRGICDNGIWFINYEILSDFSKKRLSEHFAELRQLSDKMNTEYFYTSNRKIGFNTFDIYYDKDDNIKGITKNSVVVQNDVGENLPDFESVRVIILDV